LFGDHCAQARAGTNTSRAMMRFMNILLKKF
jgi:hypothetical protein